MKTILIFIILLPYTVIAQDTCNANNKNFSYSFHIGLYYKTFLNGDYIKPTTYKEEESYNDHQFDGFNKISTFGFCSGLMISKKIAPKWHFVSGFVYWYKKDLFERKIDEVLKNGKITSTRNIHNVTKYNYQNNNVEFPLLFQFSKRNFFINSGLYISLFTFQKAKYDYVVINSKINNNIIDWHSDKKIINRLFMPINWNPTVQTGYKIKLDNLLIFIYLGFYYTINNQNDFYSQFGINIPIRKN